VRTEAVSLRLSPSHSVTCPSLSDQQVLEAIEKTLPEGPAQRNRAIFAFARRLKGIPGLADIDPMGLEPVVAEWHRRALPMIATKDYEETLANFLQGWQRVKSPVHLDYVRRVREQAEQEPVGDFQKRELRVLAGICKVLQEDSKADTFYLAVRTVGAAFGISAMHASRWLYLLEAKGLIRTVEKGGTAKNPRRATRFQYTGPPGS